MFFSGFGVGIVRYIVTGLVRLRISLFGKILGSNSFREVSKDVRRSRS